MTSPKKPSTEEHPDLAVYEANNAFPKCQDTLVGPGKGGCSSVWKVPSGPQPAPQRLFAHGPMLNQHRIGQGSRLHLICPLADTPLDAPHPALPPCLKLLHVFVNVV